MKIVDCDYFVVGSGMAGLMSALHLAAYGKVVVATKGRLQDCNTNFAQGGICCVMDPEDTFDKHARDTMIAGAWLGNSKVVHEIAKRLNVEMPKKPKKSARRLSSTAHSTPKSSDKRRSKLRLSPMSPFHWARKSSSAKSKASN